MFLFPAPRGLCAPSFLLLMASLAASLLACPATAQTHGTYSSPTYSGGSVTGKVLSSSGGPATCSNTPQLTQFTPGSYGPDTGSATVAANTDSIGGTNQCSAQIVKSPLTAAFTWTPDPSNPNEPAPSCTVLTQTCSASWSFGKDSSSTGSGSGLSNGLSNGVVTSTSSDPNNMSAVCSSTLYSAWSSSSAPSVSNSPTVSFSGTSGPGMSHPGVSGSISATYAVSAFPVFINLGGTTPDSNQNPNILVGQQCTPTVVVGADQSGHNFAGTLSNFRWVPSGTTFESWTVSSDNSHTTEVDAIPATNPTQWYWNDLQGASETVKCTVTVTPPTGQGSPFDLTVTAPKPVSVWVPTVNQNSNFVGAGYVGPYNPSNPIWMFAAPPASTSTTHYAEGSTWKTSISMPATPTFSGTGTYGYAQIIVPGETLTDGNGKSYPGPHNGLAGLDGTFPYLSDTYFADSRLYSDGDSPALPLADTFTSTALTDTFHTYLMFKPPGSNQWVPLAESLWLTNFNASEPSTGWANFPATQSVGPVSLGYNFVRQNTFPSWTAVF